MGRSGGWGGQKLNDLVPFGRLENEIPLSLPAAPPPCRLCSLQPLASLSVLDVSVFLASHGQMSAFTSGVDEAEKSPPPLHTPTILFLSYYLGKLPHDGKILFEE